MAYELMIVYEDLSGARASYEHVALLPTHKKYVIARVFVESPPGNPGSIHHLASDIVYATGSALGLVLGERDISPVRHVESSYDKTTGDQILVKPVQDARSMNGLGLIRVLASDVQFLSTDIDDPGYDQLTADALAIDPATCPLVDPVP